MKVKLVCISDIHSLQRHIKVPDGDILVVAGDLTSTGTAFQIKEFGEWLSKQPHTFKVVVAGNHDWGFEKDRKNAEANLKFRAGVADSSIYYLQDESVSLLGLKIYGSPWQPEFFDWAFNLPRGDALKEQWSQIPENTEVLITHGPPWGIRDMNQRGFSCGCEELLNRIQELPNLKVHIFGHIHESAGQEEISGVHYVNASVCDRRYRPINPIQVIEIETRNLCQN